MVTYEQLEKLRKKVRNKYIFIILILLFIYLMYFRVIWIYGEGKILPRLIMIFTVSIIIIIPSLYAIFSMFVYYGSRNREKKYSLAFKKFFVSSTLEKIFTNLEYKPDSGIDESLIASTKMISMGVDYDSNDLVIGSYKNINFMQADVFIKNFIGEDIKDIRNDRDFLFRGRWMIFEFNKKFKSNVQVCQKGFKSNKVKMGEFPDEILKYIEMESKEFNDKFSVYADNELDTFYILTPKMMERMINLDNLINGKLLFCFIDNKLHVGIYDYKDSFEPSNVFKKIDKEQVIDDILEDIKKITLFIDELDLDDDLFIINKNVE